MTKVTIDRELLERLACEVIPKTHQEMLDASEDFGAAIKELRAILAAQRQPEGEGLEVVAWFDTQNKGYLTDDKDRASTWAHEGFSVGQLCRLPDAQRAIAELRGECERLSRMLNNVTNDGIKLADERDTLRQQLAERDAENERLRVKLMTIASAEPGRHNIEWAKAMAATGNNEAYAKWSEAFDQRDKLAGLLADVKADYTHAIHWEDLHATMKRIEAALAEVNK